MTHQDRIEAMIEAEKAFVPNKIDHFKTPAGHLSYGADDRLYGPAFPGGLVFEPSAFRSQFIPRLVSGLPGTRNDKAAKLEKHIAETAAIVTGETRAGIFNDILKAASKEGARFGIRRYGPLVRAFVSENYMPISNLAVLEAAKNLVDDMSKSENINNFRLYHSGLDYNYVSVRAICYDTVVAGENYGIGVRITNGETGNAAWRIAPLIQRRSCTNSIVTDIVGLFSQRHYGLGKFEDAWVTHTTHTMALNAFRGAVEMSKGIERAYMSAIPNFGDQIAAIVADSSLPKVAEEIMVSSAEDTRNWMDVINAMTRAAQDDRLSTHRDAIEQRAGNMLAQFAQLA